MNATIHVPSIARCSSIAAALVALWLGATGCIIEGKIGDDPSGGGDEVDGHGESSGSFGTSTTTSGGGHTSSPPQATTDASGGEDSSAGSVCGDVLPEVALEVCGVMLVSPVPDGPFFHEIVECEGGASVEVVSGEDPQLWFHGECLCSVMGCGQAIGGGTSTTGGDTDTSETDGDTEDPDGCGPFPPGDGGFTCTCEMCSIDVTNVDGQWLDDEADLETICECMCGGAGCGAPL